MNGKSSFILGAVAGLITASLVYFAFLFVIPSALSDAIVSGVTLIGIGSAIGGFYVQWRGDHSTTSYLVLGFGAGIVIVAFLGAGAGVSPYIGS